VAKTEELEAKIKKIVDTLGTLRRENEHLKAEYNSIKAHVAMLTGENQKAQRAIAEADQLRKKHDQITHRVERALSTLNALRAS